MFWGELQGIFVIKGDIEGIISFTYVYKYIKGFPKEQVGLFPNCSFPTLRGVFLIRCDTSFIYLL